MEELQRFIARAQHLAEKAVSEADISAAYGIVKILLVLAEKAAGQPVKAGQTQPAKAGRKQAAMQTAATTAAKETRADDARDAQTDRGDATQRPGVTWANVVTRSPQAKGGYVKAPGVGRGKRLRTCDWHVEVVEAGKAEDIRQGVVYAGRKETGEQLGAGYRELLEMEAKDLRVALVTPGRLTDESRERIVRFDNGTEASCYVTQWGGADVERVPVAKEVEVGDATGVQLCTRTSTRRHAPR
ncbi:hypothetical protein DIPPA_18131 [Diplonema papillatum]|nr:hypothetical protein DIPPA_18131 [Diplonema papillatum]